MWTRVGASPVLWFSFFVYPVSPSTCPAPPPPVSWCMCVFQSVPWLLFWSRLPRLPRVMETFVFFVLDLVKLYLHCVPEVSAAGLNRKSLN